MTKKLIVYNSRTSFTETYARWLAEDTGAGLISLKDLSCSKASDYDVIVCSGGIYGGEINGIKKYRRLSRRFPGKRFIYFATGISQPGEQTMRSIIQNNFLGDSSVPLFYFPGGLDKEKLDPAKKTLLVCYRAMLDRRRDNTPEREVLLRRMRSSGDYTDRSALRPLTELILELDNNNFNN